MRRDGFVAASGRVGAVRVLRIDRVTSSLGSPEPVDMTKENTLRYRESREDGKGPFIESRGHLPVLVLRISNPLSPVRANRRGISSSSLPNSMPQRRRARGSSRRGGRPGAAITYQADQTLPHPAGLTNALGPDGKEGGSVAEGSTSARSCPPAAVGERGSGRRFGEPSGLVIPFLAVYVVWA